jgi:hypothetical protein
MANLKLDLLNYLRNDKFYKETELIRLAGEANMNYEEKINQMAGLLEILSIRNAQIALAEGYFAEPVAPAVVPPAGTPVQNQPAGVVHPGQTFGE